MTTQPITLEKLPPHLPLGRSIDRRHQASSPELAHWLVEHQRPVVLPGLAADWPAIHQWSFDRLAELAEDRNVIIERGNSMQSASRFETVSLRDYLHDLCRDNTPQEKEFRYLAALDLFQRLPALTRDVDFEWFRSALPIQFLFAWIGPSNTISGYHRDSPDNIVVMIRGRKLVHLVEPEHDAWMYPSRKWDYGAILSSVDALDPDLERYPNFAKVQPLSVVLEPGDALFIPRHWWHHIISLDPAISVNCFAYHRLRFLQVEGREMAKALLHHFGLYANECTCHQWVNGVRVPKPGKHPLV